MNEDTKKSTLLLWTVSVDESEYADLVRHFVASFYHEMET